MISWAKEKKPQVNVQEATNKFKIYHADNVNKDWYKKWQLWILSENPASGNSSVKSKPSQMDVYRKAIERIRNSGDSLTYSDMYRELYKEYND